MSLQLWLTAAVAIVGNVTVVVNGMLTARNATKLATRMRAVDRWDARRKSYDESCHQFLVAARMLRSPTVGARRADTAAVLAELRRAVAGMELYRPDLATGPVLAALESFEYLTSLRTDGAWSASITEAE